MCSGACSPSVRCSPVFSGDGAHLLLSTEQFLWTFQMIVKLLTDSMEFDNIIIYSWLLLVCTEARSGDKHIVDLLHAVHNGQVDGVPYFPIQVTRSHQRTTGLSAWTWACWAFYHQSFNTSKENRLRTSKASSDTGCS